MKQLNLEYKSFEDKELGYFLRRKKSIFRLPYSLNLSKKKIQDNNEGGFPVVVKIKKGNRNPMKSIRGRKNRNLAKRPPGLSLLNISRNRCLKEYGYSNAVVSRGYKVYEDGSHSWYEFIVLCN
jgi:ribosomal protein L15E